VNHPVDPRRVEQLYDVTDVAQVVVGVADDADSHQMGAASRGLEERAEQ
jgi:hypothetical protein